MAVPCDLAADLPVPGEKLALSRSDSSAGPVFNVIFITFIARRKGLLNIQFFVYDCKLVIGGLPVREIVCPCKAAGTNCMLGSAAPGWG
jgi:hypothetical protein